MTTVETTLRLQYLKHNDPTINEDHEHFVNAISGYKGDDPLSQWIPYVEWAQSTFVEENEEDDLFAVLDACLRAIMPLPQYKGNKCFLKVCVLVAEMSDDPSTFFEQLRVRGIGVGLALYYQAYGLILEADGDVEGAFKVFKQGVECHAEPYQEMIRAFSAFKSKHEDLSKEDSVTAQPQQQQQQVQHHQHHQQQVKQLLASDPEVPKENEADLSLEERRAWSSKYSAYKSKQYTTRVIRHWKNGVDVTAQRLTNAQNIVYQTKELLFTDQSAIGLQALPNIDSNDATTAFGGVLNMFSDIAGSNGNNTADFSATALFKGSASHPTRANPITCSSPTINTRRAMLDVDNMFASIKQAPQSTSSAQATSDATTNFVTTSLTVEMRRNVKHNTDQPNPRARMVPDSEHVTSNSATAPTPLRVGVLSYDATTDARAVRQHANEQPIEIDYDLFATTQEAHGFASFGFGATSKGHSELDIAEATGDVTRFNMARAQLLASQKQSQSVDIFCDDNANANVDTKANYDFGANKESLEVPDLSLKVAPSAATIGKKRGLGVRVDQSSSTQQANSSDASPIPVASSTSKVFNSQVAPPSTIKRRKSQFLFSRISDENAAPVVFSSESTASTTVAKGSSENSNCSSVAPRRRGLAVQPSTLATTPSSNDPGRPPRSTRRPSISSYSPNVFAVQTASMLQKMETQSRS